MSWKEILYINCREYVERNDMKKVVGVDSLLSTIENLRASGLGKRGCLDRLTEIIINNTIECPEDGHWREITAEEDEEMAFLGLVECTNCGLKGVFTSNYCPKCGAYMKGESK